MEAIVLTALAVFGIVLLLGFVFVFQLIRAGLEKQEGIDYKKIGDAVRSNTVNVDLSSINTKLDTHFKQLPGQVTQSITGTASTQKGKLGELIGYISLKAEYDRIIPLGSIVDFMCIKFAEGDEEGRVDFIDIKTGKHSRLSVDQKKLKDLLTKDKINFRTIKVNDVEAKD